MVNEEHETTAAFKHLVDAPEGEFRALLLVMLRKAYAEVFEVVNPERDDARTIQQQFQRFAPKSQTGPMAALFLGLCRFAGMDLATTNSNVTPRRISSAQNMRTKTSPQQRRKTPVSPSRETHAVSASASVPALDARLHKLVSGMPDEMPPLDGQTTWSDTDIEQWLGDFGVILRRIFRARS